MKTKICCLVTFLFLLSTSVPVYGELSAWESEISGDSPLNWYKFNETSGSAIDYGSAASDGTYGSGVVLNKTTPLGKGVQIVPGVDHTGVIDLSQSVLTGDWTLEVVLKVPGVGVESVLLADTGTPLRLIKLSQYPWDDGVVGYTEAGGFDAEFDYSLPYSQYAHLVFVGKSTTGVELFADGVSQGVNSNYMNLPRELIGGWPTDEMYGILDELVIYNRALGSTEIEDHYDTIPSQPAPPTIDGRIAYHSYSSYFPKSPVDSNDGHVFVYSATDDTLTKVTDGLSVAYAMNPHFSPDGSCVTFMATEPGDKNRRTELEIWVYDLAEGVLSRLMDDTTADEDPKFAPDGQTIAFKRNSQIWTINKDGTNMQQLTTSFLEKSGMNYSPDGSKMVYWVGSGDVASIWWIDSDGTDEEEIIDVADLQEYYPMYRDSDNILYTQWETTTDLHDKIYNYTISTQGTQRLSTNLYAVEDSDSFAINSTFIGFSSSRCGKGGWDIFMGNPLTGDVYTISDVINCDLHDLGASYNAYDYSRKLEMVAPVDSEELTASSTYLLKVEAFSDGGIWSGASPSVKFEGSVTYTYTNLVDDGTNGDVTSGDGIYSKSVTLPPTSGDYVVSASAVSETTNNIVSASIDVTVTGGSASPGVTITESGGSTAVSEEGPTSDSYTVVLDTQPSATVTITVDPDIETEVNNNGAGNSMDLTFLTTDWDTAQTVTVTAIDDSDVEGSHSSTITHTAASSDTGYNGINIDNVVASVTDNDGGGGEDTMYVYSIVCTRVTAGGNTRRGRASVTIYDDTDSPVENAYVTGSFSGDFFDETQSEYTNSLGVAVLITDEAATAPTFTFCVDDVTHATLTYDPNSNIETCDGYPE